MSLSRHTHTHTLTDPLLIPQRCPSYLIPIPDTRMGAKYLPDRGPDTNSQCHSAKNESLPTPFRWILIYLYLAGIWLLYTPVKSGLIIHWVILMHIFHNKASTRVDEKEQSLNLSDTIPSELPELKLLCLCCEGQLALMKIGSVHTTQGHLKIHDEA